VPPACPAGRTVDGSRYRRQASDDRTSRWAGVWAAEGPTTTGLSSDVPLAGTIAVERAPASACEVVRTRSGRFPCPSARWAGRHPCDQWHWCAGTTAAIDSLQPREVCRGRVGRATRGTNSGPTCPRTLARARP
jgi:hypothetical protein